MEECASPPLLSQNHMGSSGSKAQKLAIDEAARVARDDEEARNRLLMKAFHDGREEAMMSAVRAMEAQQNEDLMIGVGACVLTALASSIFFGSRAGRTVEQYKAEQSKATSIIAQSAQDLVLERQRVRELATVNDSQAEMIKSQASLVERSREQTASLRAKIQFMRLQHAKLKRRFSNLQVEAKSLHAQNGVLHQRFIASTSGAILMACVAGAFAIASHGSSSHHHEDAQHVAAAAVQATQTDEAQS